jgi:iron-sulfur cluster repair protein YtfE (RIC family)
MKIDPKLSVEEVARRWPETVTVLARYRIDLCCGGRHSLELVAQKHKVDLERLLKELEEAAAAKSK